MLPKMNQKPFIKYHAEEMTRHKKKKTSTIANQKTKNRITKSQENKDKLINKITKTLNIDAPASIKKKNETAET
jgi:hypothetical protein